MKNKMLLIVGGGEQGKLIHGVAVELKLFSSIKFIDDDKSEDVIGTLSELPKLYEKDKKKCVVFIAIGDNKVREKIFNTVTGWHIPVISLIHPSCYIARGVVIEENVYIGPKAIVNANTLLRRGVIINSGVIVEHDNYIGEFSHLAPGVITGGGVKVGKKSFVGLGAIINDHIELKDSITVGSGAVVNKSFSKSNIILMGIPARIAP